MITRVVLVPVCSPKGGTGKTTLGFLTAARLAAKVDGPTRYRTLLIDLDFEGTCVASAVAGVLDPPRPKRSLIDWLKWPSGDASTGSALDLLQAIRGTEVRGWVCSGNFERQDLEQLRPLIWAEGYGQHLVRRLLDVVAAVVEAEEKTADREMLVALLDCGPGLSAFALAAIDLNLDLPFRAPALHSLMLKKRRERLTVEVHRLLVTTSDRQALRAVGTLFLSHLEALSESPEATGTRPEKFREAYLKKSSLVVNRLSPRADQLEKLRTTRDKACGAPSSVTGLWDRWDGWSPPVFVAEEPRLKLFEYDDDSPLKELGNGNWSTGELAALDPLVGQIRRTAEGKSGSAAGS